MDELFTYLNDPATPFGTADLIFGLYLLYGFIRGLFRGLPAELAGIFGTVATLYLSWKFYDPVSAAIREHTRLESEAGSSLLAYLLLVLLLFLVWKAITLLLKKTLDWTCPGQIRLWGGALLGTGKSLLVLAVALTAVNLSGHEVLREHLIDQSALGRATQRVAPGFLHRHLPGVFPAPPATPDADTPVPEENSDGSGDT